MSHASIIEQPVKPIRGARVALFVTCLVDMMRPSVGFAAAKLLEKAGCQVEVPLQTCCGQPAYNSGDRANARILARQMIEAFAGYDYVVAPSGSCAGMVSHHYPLLFDDDPKMKAAAEDLAQRTFELTAFLARIAAFEGVEAHYHGVATYHDSCSSLRELGIKNEPRALLGQVQGLELRELPGSEECCGFGGTFCVKYPDVSAAIASKKCANIATTGADLLVAADLGCLMNLAGRLSREGQTVAVRHVAELLAGDLSSPPIGASWEEAPREREENR